MPNSMFWSAKNPVFPDLAEGTLNRLFTKHTFHEQCFTCNTFPNGTNLCPVIQIKCPDS